MRRGITQLRKYTPSEGPLRVDLAAFSLHPDLLLQPNDMMLPYWKRFCTALSSISSSGCISLILSAVQLDVEVMDLLLESFDKWICTMRKIGGSQLVQSQRDRDDGLC